MNVEQTILMAEFHRAESVGSEAVTCDCCGEDCTGIENHDLVTWHGPNGDVDEILCNGCIENEIGPNCHR